MRKLFFTILILCAVLYGLWRLSNSRTFQVTGELISRVEMSDSLVALTFDDGPTPGYTDEILDVLNKHAISATFFLTGAEIETNQREAEKIINAGHQVGNHSYSHLQMILKRPEFIRNEIERTDYAIRKAGFSGEIYFRPPYGKKLFVLPVILESRGQTSVTWDIEPEFFAEVRSSAEAIAGHVEEKVTPGSIILLHVMYPSGEESRRAVPMIIENLQQQGYRFVTVDELIQAGDREAGIFSVPES